MNNLGVIGALSSCATLLLFVFYFTGRVASIINNRGLIYEKIDVYYNRDSIPSGLKIVDGYELNQGEYLIITSNKGLKYIKIFEYIYDEKKCKYHKGKLFYEYYGLNIGQAIEINT